MYNKKIITIALCALSIFTAKAQVAQTNIVEHFTNTSCGICAGANVGIHNAINATPGTLHISFHPSAPYSNDFFNTQNSVENDARTNYYGIYGGTPRVLVNGTIITTSTLSTNLAGANGMTNFAVQAQHTLIGTDSFAIKVIIKKVAADTTTNAVLFVGVTEDTISQTTNNGETKHYNVFRKALTNIVGNSVALPAMVGDSIIQSFAFKAGSAWQVPQLHAMAILQTPAKKVINSAKSGVAPVVVLPTSIGNTIQLVAKNAFYPNPFTNTISTAENITQLMIINGFGQIVLNKTNTVGIKSVDVSLLPKGYYTAKFYIDSKMYTQQLVK